jgi:hypothetical protein
MSDDDAYIMGFNQLGVMSNLPWQDFFISILIFFNHILRNEFDQKF